LFFLFFPTAYPRPLYPEVDNILVAGAMKFIAVADNPNNCFPSMHIALTGVSSWAIRFLSRRLHLLFWLWTLTIYVSTLTTKQHYFLDILGGIAVMLIIASLEWALFERKKIARVFEREVDNTSGRL
jgi:membrane-associated phospholipid phosphatase